MGSELDSASLLRDIKQVIEQARGQVKQAVNSAMVQAYWQIGYLIVEQEQQGSHRAEYGKAQLKQLSEQLTQEFGKGFDVTNLRNMRRFYLAYPNRDAVRLELSWTHYRILLRIEKNNARQWYQREAITQNWSVRALERQVGTLYYERLLASKDKAQVEDEAVVKYSVLSDQKQLFAAKYLPYLPTEEELQQALLGEREKIQQSLQQKGNENE